MTDIVQYATNTKWKWAGHFTRMKGIRWTTRSTERQIKDVRSVGRPKRHWTADIVGQQGVVWTRIAKDRESWRTGGGLHPSVEGLSLEQNRIVLLLFCFVLLFVIHVWNGEEEGQEDGGETERGLFVCLLVA